YHTKRTLFPYTTLFRSLYWAREYHMDGFRFDLMALLDTQLMERIRAALDAEYGKGEKILYGEPWSAHSSPMRRGAKPAGKRALRSEEHTSELQSRFDLV